MRHRVTWKGIVAGAAGGLIGAWTMNQAQALLARLKQPQASSGIESAESDDATMRAADKGFSILARQHLSREQERKAGPIVHYAFGAVMGALYGGVVERRRHLTRAAGLIFGAALFVSADEIGVPLAGLSGPPTDYPISTHLQALAAHVVYGATADLVRKGVRSAL